MFSIFEDEDFIQLKISTDMRHVKTLMHQVRKFLQRYCSVQDDNPLILILRELISNAIEHGNRNTENLSIMVSVEHTGNQIFKIIVEDEGKGFDYKNAEIKAGEPVARNRGLGLVKAVSERIEFSGKGNSVSAWVKISRDPEFAVNSLISEDGKEWAVIHPADGVTAGNAPKFRNVLLDLLSRGCTHYRFDLADVDDMDSVSLSIFIKFSNLLRDRHPDAQLEIVNANPDIVNLMRMTRLNRVYRIE